MLTLPEAARGEAFEIYRPPRRGSFNGPPGGKRPAAAGRPPRRPWQAPASLSFERLEHSPGRPCEVPHCGRMSRPGRRYCNTHRQRSAHFGHPEMTRHVNARRLFGGVIGDSLRLIGWLKRRPITDPARGPVENALIWLQAQLENAQRYTYWEWAPWEKADITINRRLAQLRRHGVTADQVLAHVCGFVWAATFLEAMIRDQRHLEHQLGRAVLSLVNVPHGTDPERREAIGAQAAITFGKRLLERVGYVADSIAFRTGFMAGRELPARFAGPVPRGTITRANRHPAYRPLSYEE